MFEHSYYNLIKTKSHFAEIWLQEMKREKKGEIPKFGGAFVDFRHV